MNQKNDCLRTAIQRTPFRPTSSVFINLKKNLFILFLDILYVTFCIYLVKDLMFGNPHV